MFSCAVFALTPLKGHGGSEAAEVAGKKMHKMLAKKVGSFPWENYAKPDVCSSWKIHACKHKNGTFDEFIAEVPQILTELFQEVFFFFFFFLQTLTNLSHANVFR